jgi:hypothetical protein
LKFCERAAGQLEKPCRLEYSASIQNEKHTFFFTALARTCWLQIAAYFSTIN